MDPWHVQQVEPQTLIMEKIIMEKIIMEKNNYGKTGQSLFHRKNQLWKKWNYGKKKGSDHFRDILNPYGGKPNYGKIGRRCRLSKLNVFFSIILSDAISVSGSFGLFGVCFCFASFLSCSRFCSRRPPEACGEGSYDVSGADPEICWWRLYRWTTAIVVSRSSNQPTNLIFL